MTGCCRPDVGLGGRVVVHWRTLEKEACSRMMEESLDQYIKNRIHPSFLPH